VASGSNQFLLFYHLVCHSFGRGTARILGTDPGFPLPPRALAVMPLLSSYCGSNQGVHSVGEEADFCEEANMILGVLGGIGAGKTTVVRLLADCAVELVGSRCPALSKTMTVEVIDADLLAHKALEQADVQAQLRAWLGDEIFNADGSVERQVLGRLVFNDGNKLKRLESLIHPVVRDEIAARIKKFQATASDPWDLCILDVPLLATSPVRDQCDSILYVDVDTATREHRVTKSRGWAAGELARRERFQTSEAEKRQLVDWVIDNSGELEASDRSPDSTDRTATTREQVRLYLDQWLSPLLASDATSKRN